MAKSASANRKDDNKIGLGIKITLIAVALLCVFMLGYMAVDSTGMIDRNTTAMTVGEDEISVSELNQYYYTTRNGFLNQYYETLIMYGYDLTSGTFDASLSLFDSTKTWKQYFTEEAKAAAEEFSILYQEGQKAGYTMSQDDQDQYDTYMETLASAAETEGVSLNKYVKLLYGSGTKLSDVEDYYSKRVYAAGYYNTLLDSFGIGDAEIDAYYAEHQADYDLVEYYAYDVDYEIYTYAADSTEEGAPKSDEEAQAMTAASMDAAQKDAQALVDKLAADGSNFDESIQSYLGSGTTYGTGHKEVTLASASSAIQTWLQEDGRAAGDKAAVLDETNSVYTVIVYLGTHMSDKQTVAVRHTLLGFESAAAGATDEEIAAVEEANAGKKAQAETLYEEWKAAGATEDAFIQLAKDHSTDGTAATGGLYTGVYEGQMVAAFEDWCFDESRQPGDHGIVETEYGYHIMYFVEHEGLQYRSNIRAILEAEAYNTYLEEHTGSYTTVYNDKAINMM